MSSFKDATTGRWYHNFRQSTLDSVDMCAERGRLVHADEMPRVETDSTAFGTACHAGAEYLLGQRQRGEPSDLVCAVGMGIDILAELQRQENFEWNKFSGMEMAEDAVDRCLTAWYEEIYDRLDPLDIEWNFHTPLYADDTRSISLKGTADLVATNLKLWDWKFPSREYKAWEKNRYGTQPTVYAAALRHTHKISGPITFHYGIVTHAGKVQIITVERDERHDEWLKRKCLALAQQVEAELPQWPLNDQGWHCSPVWCENWSNCRGADLGPDPWNQLKEAA